MTRVSSPTPTRRRWWLLVAIFGFLVLLGAATAVAFFTIPGLLLRRVNAFARTQGLALQVTTLEPHVGRLILTGVTFAPLGVAGVSGRAEHVTVDLRGLTPVHLNAEHVTLTFVGRPSELVVAMNAWASVHPAATRAPLTATAVAITWTRHGETSPPFSAAGGTATMTPSGGNFHTNGATLQGASLGRIAVAWTTAESFLRLHLGGRTDADAPWDITLTPASPPSVDITIAAIPLADLAAAVGKPLPPQPITVRADASLTFRPSAVAEEDDVIDGTLRTTLDGFVPSHPRELNGIVFGNATTVTTKFRVAHPTITLTDTLVVAGALRLAGNGRFQTAPTGTTLVLDLSGSLPCTAVARSAAVVNLGPLFGGLAGDLAAQTLQGSLGIRVHLDADVGNLSAARARPQITGGCGLRPFVLPSFP